MKVRAGEGRAVEERAVEVRASKVHAGEVNDPGVALCISATQRGDGGLNVGPRGSFLFSVADRAWKKFGRPRAEVRHLEIAEPESEPLATPGIVAPIKEGGSSPGATTGFPDGCRRACEDLIRDPVLVRELLQNSWDETGKKLGEGNDWHGSPRLCHEAYDHHLLRWADGADIRVADMEPAHVRWLERPGLFVGPMEKLKYVQFIRLEGDLVIPQDMALKDPGPEYPGWDDETQRPSEGRRCGWRTRAAVLEAVKSGKAVDRPAICELSNTKAWREANPELDLWGCKGFKRKQIDKTVERLIHDGQLYGQCLRSAACRALAACRASSSLAVPLAL